MSEERGVSRRTLVRVLIGLGIGIPLLVEGATFATLISERLFGHDGDEGDRTTRPPPTGVEPGEAMLPETVAVERLSAASVDADDSPWRLAVSVVVENAGEVPYELRLRGVRVGDAETLDDAPPTTGTLAPGETGAVTGTFDLPADGAPTALLVETVTGDGDPVRRTVALGSLPRR